jgi:two-component system, NarL family, sensor kinase
MENNRFRHFIKTHEMKQRMIVDYLQNELNQTIISAKIKNDLIEKQPEKPILIRKYCKEIKILLEKAFRDVYSISSLIYPLPIDDVGFKYAIEDMCKNMLNKQNIQVKYEINSETLPFESKIILYRVIEKILVVLNRKSNYVLLRIGIVKSSIVLKISWNAAKGFRTRELNSTFPDLEEYLLLLKGRMNSKLLLNRNIMTILKVPIILPKQRLR